MQSSKKLTKFRFIGTLNNLTSKAVIIGLDLLRFSTYLRSEATKSTLSKVLSYVSSENPNYPRDVSQ